MSRTVSSATSQALIDLLAGARRERRAVSPPSAVRALGLGEAYDVQDGLRARLVASGRRVIGWKAGFTNAAVQAQFKASAPVCGFLLDDGVYPTGTAVPLDRFVALAVEAEVAFVLGEPLAGPGVTAAGAARAVRHALPALELIDVRYTPGAVGTDVVAEGVYANAIVLGTPPLALTGLDLEREPLSWELNGEVAATSATDQVMGSPLNALAWIANHLGARGQGLEPGDLAMTGSVSVLLRPGRGDTVTARFGTLGTVTASFA